MKNILLFASGGGSNVQAILNYFAHSSLCTFPAIVTNNKNAGVIHIAQRHGMEVVLVNKDIFSSEVFLDMLDSYKPDLLVLAGFLWKIPSYLVKAYSGKIINIHPALLPKFGGKGMYGHHVHEAVIAAGEPETGITIHQVNEAYDESTILLQKKISVNTSDPSILAQEVLALEHEWYSKVIEQIIRPY
jgi:phosphoribosylglycinamide formyltransferase-1